MAINDLINIFPNLSHDKWSRTSSETDSYNCIAWAAGENFRRWWPVPPPSFYYWPLPVISYDDCVFEFVRAFSTLGYSECGLDDSLKPGFNKVAIYALHGRVKHMAFQLDNGFWSSKCGDLEDISHSLLGLEGNEYGYVELLLERRNS